MYSDAVAAYAQRLTLITVNHLLSEVRDLGRIHVILLEVCSVALNLADATAC